MPVRVAARGIRVALLARGALLLGVALAVQSATSPLDQPRTEDPPALSEATSYYVDCQAADDTAAGTDADQPWQSLQRAADAAQQSGDSVYLKRGCVWEGPVTFAWSGVLVLPYGDEAESAPRVQLLTGNLATEVITVTGNDNVLDGLSVRSDPPAVVPAPDPNANDPRLNASVRGVGCPGTGHGTATTPYRDGVVLAGNHNTLQHSTLTELVDGVTVRGASNRVLYNEIFNINQDGTLSLGGNDDFGAQGIELNGPDNEVAFNWLHDNSVCDYDFGVDGSHIAVWGNHHADRNLVHHNRADHSVNFAEMDVGGGTAIGNVFSDNMSTRETFLIAGKGTLGTLVLHNTIYADEPGHGGILCGGCGSSAINIADNIIDTRETQIFSDGPIQESGNVLWSPSSGGSICLIINAATCGSPATADKVVDPAFVDAAGGNLQLTQDSPALTSAVAQIGARPSVASVR